MTRDNFDHVTVVKEFTFDSAHCLPDHPGKCKQVHGHTYKLQIGIQGPINQAGMIIDFGDLKEAVKNRIIEPLDHKMLNDVEEHGFPGFLPTAENMVIWIRDVLFAQFPHDSGLKVILVRLWETPTSYAEWRAWL